MRAYRTVLQRAQTETVIQRSRFIGRCFPVCEEGEALALLNEIRKLNWDASHNCFAYRIGEAGQCARFSDDGEPGGTAGKPIMDVLTGRDVTNTLIIVTRYFGGILLGAGGLVRAYSKAAADACLAGGLAEMRPATRLSMRIDYPRYGSLEKLLREKAQILNTEFGADVLVEAMVESRDARSLCEAIVDKTDGRCVPQTAGEDYMCVTL